MATRHRGLETQLHPDRENYVQKNGKSSTITSRSLVPSRPALGEVGNKLCENKHDGPVKKSENFVHPRALPKTLKPSKEGKTGTVPHKENAAISKKIDAVASLPSKTYRRQESILKPVAQKEEKIKNNKVKFDEVTSYSSKQIDIIDPDSDNKNEPQMVVEYLSDIFSYLRELEEEYPIREKFLESHQVTPRMRGILVNWLVEVHINFKFCLETLHMCISLIDRYLQDNRHVGRETLQLVGTSAMLVAGKYEEMYIPELSDFVYICDDIFSGTQILQMEIEILKKLNFNLGRPLPIHFLRRYSKIAHVKPDHHNLSKYILELALLDYETCHIKPSIQAAAACCLSVAILNELNDPSKVWTPTLVHYTTYKYSDFKSVIVTFAHLLKKIEVSNNQAIREKYASATYAKISLNMKLKGPLIRKLTATLPSLK